MSAAVMQYARDRSHLADGMLYRAPTIELSASERRAYNLAAAMLDVADERGRRSLAWEISETLRVALEADGGLYRGGLLVPHSITTALHGTRAGLDTATATKGAELKFTEPGPFIEALRKKAVVLRLGATELEGLRGDIKLPRQTAPGTAVFITQNPGSDTADTSLTLDQASLSPKEVQGTTSYSRQLLKLAESSTGVDKLVRADLAEDHAVAIDAAAIQGSGSGGNPLGITNTSGVGLVAAGTNGAQTTWANVTGLELAVANANADTEPTGMAYLTSPTIRNSWRNKDRSSGTSGWFIMSDGQTLNGYTVGVSNNVPQTLTKGTSVGVCHAIIFGLFRELLLGLWGGLEIINDPFRLKKQGMVELTSYELVDVTVRHPASFAVCLDALP
jgi:HK97 family phage major capsid protein